MQRKLQEKYISETSKENSGRNHEMKCSAHVPVHSQNTFGWERFL